jgi:hypothetical protein
MTYDTHTHKNKNNNKYPGNTCSHSMSFLPVNHFGPILILTLTSSTRNSLPIVVSFVDLIEYLLFHSIIPSFIYIILVFSMPCDFSTATAPMPHHLMKKNSNSFKSKCKWSTTEPLNHLNNLMGFFYYSTPQPHIVLGDGSRQRDHFLAPECRAAHNLYLRATTKLKGVCWVHQLLTRQPPKFNSWVRKVQQSRCVFVLCGCEWFFFCWKQICETAYT